MCRLCWRAWKPLAGCIPVKMEPLLLQPSHVACGLPQQCACTRVCEWVGLYVLHKTISYVPPQKLEYLAKKHFSRKKKKNTRGERWEKAFAALFSEIVWLEILLERKQVGPEIQFFIDISFNLNIWEEKKNAHGKFRDLFKSVEIFGIGKQQHLLERRQVYPLYQE